MRTCFGDDASCVIRVDHPEVHVAESGTRWLYGAFSMELGGSPLGDITAEETLDSVAAQLDFTLIHAAFLASRDVGMSACDATSAYHRLDGAVYDEVYAEAGDEELTFFGKCRLLSAIDSMPRLYLVPGSNLQRFVWDEHGSVREARVAAGAFVAACEQFVDYVQRLTKVVEPPPF